MRAGSKLFTSASTRPCWPVEYFLPGVENHLHLQAAPSSPPATSCSRRRHAEKPRTHRRSAISRSILAVTRMEDDYSDEEYGQSVRLCADCLFVREEYVPKYKERRAVELAVSWKPKYNSVTTPEDLINKFMVKFIYTTIEGVPPSASAMLVAGSDSIEKVCSAMMKLLRVAGKIKNDQLVCAVFETVDDLPLIVPTGVLMAELYKMNFSYNASVELYCSVVDYQIGNRFVIAPEELPEPANVKDYSEEGEKSPRDQYFYPESLSGHSSDSTESVFSSDVSFNDGGDPHSDGDYDIFW